MIDRETAQEHIDDARAEAERVAATEIAELRATHEDEIAQLREQLAGAESARERYGRELTEVSQSRAWLLRQTECHAAEIATLRQQLAELEPMRPLMDALHLELSRRGGDCIEYLPEVPGHSPAMLRLGRVILTGATAGPLLEALRDAALDFTQDKED